MTSRNQTIAVVIAAAGLIGAAGFLLYKGEIELNEFLNAVQESLTDLS